MSPRPTTYWDFIRVEELLSLQGGLAQDESQLDSEEIFFITVHQVFELWFKLVLRELREARDLFGHELVEEQTLSGVVQRLRRASSIFRAATHHFEVVETLGTREYLEFRTKLMPASGFQSAQMRQIEILLGLEEDERIAMGPADTLQVLRDPDGSKSPAFLRVEAQLADRPTLKEAIETWLLRTPIDGVRHDAPESEAALEEFVARYIDAHAAEVEAGCAHAMSITEAEEARGRLAQLYARERESAAAFLRPGEDEGGLRRTRIRAAMLFIETYRDLPLLAWPREVLAALLELEQAFLIFRQRHARMVERVIGRRTGTAGSEGVAYLDKTALEYRIFRDLWAVRTLMIRPSAAPTLERADFYGFSSGGG